MRSIYDGMIDAARTKPNYLDGSSPSRAIPLKPDQTLVQYLGLVEHDVSDAWIALSQAYRSKAITYAQWAGRSRGFGRA